MSSHPNALLIAVLTPDGLSRSTMRDILADAKVKDDDDVVIPPGAKVKYEPGMPAIPFELHHQIMESSYDDDWQISAKEGDLVFFKMVTYGYGENISWENLEAMKTALEAWCKDICERFHCKYEIRVSANYW